MVYTLFNFDDGPEDFFERVRNVLRWGAVCYPMRYQPCNTLKKNSYVSKKWTKERIELVASARRVIGYGGAFPPYAGLLNKLRKAKDFDDAFSLYPIDNTRNKTSQHKQKNKNLDIYFSN